MTQDPTILAPILAVVTFAVVMGLAYLAGRLHAKRRLRDQEPRTHGEEGGHPKPLYAMTPCRPDTPAKAGDKPYTPMTHMEAENQ